MQTGVARDRRRSGAVSAASLAVAGLLVLVAGAAGRAAPAQVELRVAKEGLGVVRTPSGKLDCGSRCVARFNAGKLVTLLAAGAGSTDFAGWSGACSGTLPRCTLHLDRAATATARFKPAFVDVGLVVAGRGQVTSNPSGIVCGGSSGNCSSAFAKLAPLTLTAKPAGGSVFAGWLGGGCSGTETCRLEPGEHTFVRAAFRRVHAVSAAGSGSGTVESSLWPDCELPCSAVSPSGETVTLRAVPAAGQSFRVWSGACTGAAPTCVLRTDAVASVNASFGAPLAVPGAGQQLSVTTSGPGRVTGGGIDCGTVCAVKPATAVVQLKAAPSLGAAFAGWSGDCGGAAPVCQVSLAGARSVTATFVRRFTLALTPALGNPRVDITPPGLTCSAACSTGVAAGDLVTLVVDVPPQTGTARTRVTWFGSCVGNGPVCTVAVDGATSVSVTAVTIVPLTATRYGLVVSSRRREPSQELSPDRPSSPV